MKSATIVIIAIFTLLGAPASADQFETLAGYRDFIKVPAGETALVLFATDALVVQYQKQGKRPVQFRLGQLRCNNNYNDFVGYRLRSENRPSTSQPLALVGPAKISLMTDGVVSIRVVSSR